MQIAGSYRKNVYKEIHEICFHGQGGYSWSEVYQMPIWVRKFIFEELRQYYEEQNNQSSSSTSTNLLNPDGTVNKPAFVEATKGYTPNKKAPKY